MVLKSLLSVPNKGAPAFVQKLHQCECVHKDGDTRKQCVVLYIHAAIETIYHNVCADSSKNVYRVCFAHLCLWACAPQAARSCSRTRACYTWYDHTRYSHMVTSTHMIDCLMHAHCCSICILHINNKLIGFATTCSTTSIHEHGDESYQCCLASSRPPRLGDPAMGL